MADFVEVMKIKNRMCDNFSSCCTCPISSYKNGTSYECEHFSTHFPEQAQKILFKWAEEHPIFTNADKIREIFGLTKAEFNPQWGCLLINCDGKSCDKCSRKNFWDREYK